ncbi:Bacteriophage lysis protein [Caballeronia pedi]|uniref:Bacteriophage lysis protein n=1 Tax=Caballeronia pedi TaxID=1777141 RepID=A0A158BI12_9BURK|nr:lysis system i-spanin subunit Rz [Caballeronia pedi]SAK69406.1 Bacteriophage lysis protein [Caballeronia pedi]
MFGNMKCAVSTRAIAWLAAGLVGVCIGATTAKLVENRKLVEERISHARDNEKNAQKFATVSEHAARVMSDAIAVHNAAAESIAALDKKFHREKTMHEADNAKNRAAIADGTRRLCIAIANAGHGHTPDPNPAAGGMGDGTCGYAELSPAVGKDLFEIVDDADDDARAKAEYLQRYVCTLQQSGVIAGHCSTAYRRATLQQ